MANDEYLKVVKDLSVLNMSLNNHPFDEAIYDLEDKILSNQYKGLGKSRMKGTIRIEFSDIIW